MKLYIVLEFPNPNIDHEDQVFDPFIVGIFSKKSIANAVAKDLKKKNKTKYDYFVEDYELNNLYYKTQEEVDKEISQCIEELVKEGLMDYTVGEDGKFYFELTEKGKKEIK